MGIDVVGLLDRATEMADACRLDEGNPGLELGLALGEALARRPRQGLPARRRRLRPLGRAADRRVDRQAGQGARAGARASRATGRTARRTRCGFRTRSSSGRSSSAGSSRPRSRARSSGSTRSTSPTSRPRRTRRTRCSPAGDVTLEPESSIDELLDGAEAPDYICIQAFVNPTDENAARIDALAGLARGALRLRRHARLRPALPPFDRPAPQGRPDDRALPPDRRGLRRGAPDPRQAVRLRPADPRAGRGRLRVARERGRRVARIRLEEVA